MAGEELITFTAAMRRKTCFHEAAHAIVHGLHPFCHVCSLAVAPEGSKEGEWEYRNRKDRVSTDIWGACITSDTDLLIRWFMFWDSDEGRYVVSDDDAVAQLGVSVVWARAVDFGDKAGTSNYRISYENPLLSRKRKNGSGTQE